MDVEDTLSTDNDVPDDSSDSNDEDTLDDFARLIQGRREVVMW